MNMILLRKQNGDGMAVVVYGVTLMLVFTFLAINLLNGKIIENGYNSLRDSIQSASTGSVIHLLTSTDTSTMTGAQSEVIQNNGKEEKEDSIPPYDIYLQLALGYIINRAPANNTTIADPSKDNVVVQTGNVNNFIKLDHKKVVSSTLALLEDSVLRGKDIDGNPLDIYDTEHFKILMIFIEPHYNNDNYQKYFNIIVYGNGNVEENADGSLELEGKTYFAGASGNMTAVYNNLNRQINDIVNSTYPISSDVNYAFQDPKMRINVSLTDGNVGGEELMRKMETKPYYLIVVKDFALPTLFRQTYTHAEEKSNIFRDAFQAISGDGHLRTPIIALNSAKVERKLEGSKK